MAEFDDNIIFGNIYKQEHGNTPIISGSKFNYNILVKNNWKMANRAMHGSLVAIGHQIG
jgi:hypothetical protein